jgi:hypothetical protein
VKSVVMGHGRGMPPVAIGPRPSGRRRPFLVALTVVLVGVVLWVGGRVRGGGGGDSGGATPVTSVPAQATQRPVGGPLIEPLPPRPQRGGAAVGVAEVPAQGAVEQAVGTRTRAEASLLADYARANIQPPPIVNELFDMHRRGVAPQEMRAFVRARFPRLFRLRLLTQRWINRIDPARPRAEPGGARPPGRRQAALGAIQPAGRAPNPARR